MIEVSDLNGRRHFLAASAVASVSEASQSAAWHGVRAFVRLFDGTTLEVRETATELRVAVEKEAA